MCFSSVVVFGFLRDDNRFKVHAFARNINIYLGWNSADYISSGDEKNKNFNNPG